MATTNDNLKVALSGLPVHGEHKRCVCVRVVGVCGFEAAVVKVV